MLLLLLCTGLLSFVVPDPETAFRARADVYRSALNMPVWVKPTPRLLFFLRCCFARLHNMYFKHTSAMRSDRAAHPGPCCSGVAAGVQARV